MFTSPFRGEMKLCPFSRATEGLGSFLLPTSYFLTSNSATTTQRTKKVRLVKSGSCVSWQPSKTKHINMCAKSIAVIVSLAVTPKLYY